MAKSKRKQQKLKVFRTPIGFHDAYVAAPSQKAALEAWGSDTNLFARGSAEQVEDPELMEVPLENPGQVVKVLRGTKEEQLAALAKQQPTQSRKSRSSRAAKAEVVPKARKKRPPKPSRTALRKAEEAAGNLEKRQAAEMDKIEQEIAALEKRRSELQRRQERERDKAQEKLESERSDHESAMRRYDSG